MNLFKVTFDQGDKGIPRRWLREYTGGKRKAGRPVGIKSSRIDDLWRNNGRPEIKPVAIPKISSKQEEHPWRKKRESKKRTKSRETASDSQ